MKGVSVPVASLETRYGTVPDIRGEAGPAEAAASIPVGQRRGSAGSVRSVAPHIGTRASIASRTAAISSSE